MSAVCTVVGRVNERPEVRHSQRGSVWCGVRVTITKRIAWGNRKGETIQYGVRLKLFGDRAADFCNVVQAGDIVCATGEPQADAWMPKDADEPKATLELRVESWTVVAGNDRESGYDQRSPRRQPDRAPRGGGYSGGAMPDPEEKVPF